MTLHEIHDSIKLGLDKSEALEYPHFEPEELDHWINVVIKRYVKTRYSGNNLKGSGFEQTQKRIDDIRTLVKEIRITLTDGASNIDKPNSRIALLPEEYWFSLSEEVLIAYVGLDDSTTVVTSGNLVAGSVYKVLTGTITHDGTGYSADEYFVASVTTFTGSGTICLATTKRVGITEVTADNYSEKLDDPYSEHVLHYEEARPLRLFHDDHIEFISDGDYGIIYCYLRYLKAPQEVDIADVASGSIEEGVLYEVYGGTSITYNGVTYAADETFVGVSGFTVYAENGGTEEVCITTDLPFHTHDEIVANVVNVLLENIEQPRYQTHSSEMREVE